MKTVAVGEFKQTCLRLLEDVRRTGKPMLVTKRGQPLALVSPPALASRGSWHGAMKGTFDILGDIVSPVIAPGERKVLRDEAHGRHPRVALAPRRPAGPATDRPRRARRSGK